MDLGITVTGVGSATGAPDVLCLDLGAEASARDVAGALGLVSDAAARMRAALVAAGVEERDLSTVDMGVWSLDDGGRAPKGYGARLAMRARVRNMAAAGPTITAAAAAGGDAARLHGVSFEHADSAALLADARAGAWGDAEAKARQYAALAGRALGPVLAVDEVSGRGGGPWPLGPSVAALRAESMPVDAGESAVRVSLTVRWELGPAAPSP